MKLSFIKQFLLSNFKYVFYGLTLLLVLFLAQKWKSQKDYSHRLFTDIIGKNQELQKLTEYSANLERKYVSQETLLNEVSREWQKEKFALIGRITMLSDATFLIRERARESGKSDLTYVHGTDGSGYLYNEVRFNGGPPVGYVMVFSDGRVVSKVYNHEIDVKMAVSREEATGYYSVLSKANYVLKSGHLQNDGKNWFGVPYPLKIKGGTALIDPTEPSRATDKKFYLWSPRFSLGVNASGDGLAPALGASFMGYGRSRNDLDFKMLQVGAQKGKNGAGLFLAPIMWRPFDEVLPNTYVGPGMSVDQEGQRYFLGISLGF